MALAANSVEGRAESVPFTVQHLGQLKPAEEYRYYTGNFVADIQRSEQDACDKRIKAETKEGLLKYAALLRFVEIEAKSLAANGRILLRQKKLQRKITVSVKDEEGKVVGKPYLVPTTEYYAIGL